MGPSLELVGIREHESFKVWTHGYPYETVRWHFHPEYEINLITDTSGRYFVGDHTDRFESGQLCMIGPNVPHNWVSEIDPGTTVTERCIVLQFSDKVLQRGAEAFPELDELKRLLNDSKRGLLFSPKAAALAAVMLRVLLEARGLQRITCFLSLLSILANDNERRMLTSPAFRSDAERYQSSTINQVLSLLAERLHERLREADIARYADMQESAFSRFFRRNTGLPFVQYLNRLRINRACELLVNSDTSITDICFICGFNNVSNFNRQFLALKAMPPSQFRRFHRLNNVVTSVGLDGAQRDFKIPSFLPHTAATTDCRTRSPH